MKSFLISCVAALCTPLVAFAGSIPEPSKTLLSNNATAPDLKSPVSVSLPDSITKSDNCNGCLLLTPYIALNATSEARRLSEVDSKEYYGIKSHTGFITVKPEYNSNLFFWFFPHEKMSEKPWIIWLQGGPGVSSTTGLFDIMGPISIKDGKVTRRNVTWASDYSLLFLDNPVGAGFSYTDDEKGYPDNEDDVGGQMLEFLVQFLKIFPELKTAPLFIAGQSYGGKYVPAVAIKIHRHNARESKENSINLRGISIGNGLIDMKSMMHYGELCTVHGIVDEKAGKVLSQMDAETVRLIDEGKMVDASNKFNQTIEYIKKESGVSVYNYNKNPSTAAPDFEAYLERKDVRDNIHVGDAKFDYNNQHVYYKMLPDISNTTKPWVEELLENYGVLLYTGQVDVILAYGLARHFYAELKWSKRDAYDQAPRTHLRLKEPEGPVVGYMKAGGNLVEAIIRDAGHSAVAEQPEVGKFMIDSFIKQYK